MIKKHGWYKNLNFQSEQILERYLSCLPQELYARGAMATKCMLEILFARNRYKTKLWLLLSLLLVIRKIIFLCHEKSFITYFIIFCFISFRYSFLLCNQKNYLCIHVFDVQVNDFTGTLDINFETPDIWLYV